MSDALTVVILAAADAVEAARDQLGVLDGAAGDGDHGMTMSIAARNVRRKLATAATDMSVPDLLRLVALAVGDVGGAIGPLYSGALAAIATEVETTRPVPSSLVARLRRAAEAAEVAISNLGHAVPGDKTVIDALHPLVESLRHTEAHSADPGLAIARAVRAADAGAASTADMVARIGRASRLGERSRGLPDAGASSFAIIVRAMAGAHLRDRSGNG